MTFVNNVKIVNDLAERGISLVQDYVDKTVDEDQLQTLLQVVEWHKDNLKKGKKVL